MKSKLPDDRSPRIYTVSEAARLLNLNEAKVRKAIVSEELLAARLGRIYRIREADLMRYFDEKLVRSDDPLDRGEQ